MAMTLKCPKCKKEAHYVKEDDTEKLGMYAFNCECGEQFASPKSNPSIKYKTMSCKAKINGEVTKRGETSIEFYKDGKPQCYCKGYVDNSTEELIETCKNCKENVIYAQEELEKMSES